MGKLVVWLALILVAVSAAVRLAPSAPSVWHVDPRAVTKREPRHSYLLGPGGDAPAIRVPMPPDEAAARIEAIALATPRTERLAGQGPWMTFITRSAAFGFPDYTSILVSPGADGDSEIAIYARSRFGKGDFGVNKARVQAWIAELMRRPAVR